MNLFYLFLIIPTVCIAAIIDFNPTDLLGKLPKCSLECVLKGATSQGCEITDLSCQCSHLEALSRTVAPCLVHAGCSLEDLISTQCPPYPLNIDHSILSNRRYSLFSPSHHSVFIFADLYVI